MQDRVSKFLKSILVYFIVEQALHQAFDKKIQFIFNKVPKEWAHADSYCQLIPNDDPAFDCYDIIPRIGAFEVTYNGIVIFSKLLG